MPNISPEQVAEAIADVIGGAENQGIVLTDRRLAQSNPELIKLLKSAADSEEWWGWLVSWSSIAAQTNDNDCIIDTTYRFMAMFQHFYANDYKPGLSTDIAFQRIIFAANEELNANLDLGLGNTVRHQSLISEGEFETDDEGGGSANTSAHLALFSIEVIVTNTY